MRLEELGFNAAIEQHAAEVGRSRDALARVVAEHKERYVVRAEAGEMEAEITGNLRFAAGSRGDFPAVGDWVGLAVQDAGFAIIRKILPRSTVIARPAVGKFGETQIIAANIDFALIALAVDRDFSLNRVERYLAICHGSGVGPIVLLTKTDLVAPEAVAGFVESVDVRIAEVPVLAISNETRNGHDALREHLRPGATYCLLGSSGVGKSTLINRLSGREIMKTGEIGRTTQRGRHVTSHRELIVLEGGAILIDNPGMREVGMADAGDGIAATFGRIAELARGCRFKDCTHTRESGCAVTAAVEAGELDRASYDNYLKMEKEQAFFESTAEERRRKDKKFGKMMKNYNKSFKKGDD